MEELDLGQLSADELLKSVSKADLVMMLLSQQTTLSYSLQIMSALGPEPEGRLEAQSAIDGLMQRDRELLISMLSGEMEEQTFTQVAEKKRREFEEALLLSKVSAVSSIIGQSVDSDEGTVVIPPRTAKDLFSAIATRSKGGKGEAAEFEEVDGEPGSSNEEERPNRLTVRQLGEEIQEDIERLGFDPVELVPHWQLTAAPGLFLEFQNAKSMRATRSGFLLLSWPRIYRDILLSKRMSDPLFLGNWPQRDEDRVFLRDGLVELRAAIHEIMSEESNKPRFLQLNAIDFLADLPDILLGNPAFTGTTADPLSAWNKDDPSAALAGKREAFEKSSRRKASRSTDP